MYLAFILLLAKEILSFYQFFLFPAFPKDELIWMLLFELTLYVGLLIILFSTNFEKSKALLPFENLVPNLLKDLFVY